MEQEEALTGGNAGGAVVRIGDTVRKPWAAVTPSVVSFVEHLRESGVAATVGESAADLRRTAVRMEMRGGAGRISDDGRRVSDARGPAGCPA